MIGEQNIKKLKYNLSKLIELDYVKSSEPNRYEKLVGDSLYIIVLKFDGIHKYVNDYRKVVEIPLSNEELSKIIV